MPPNVENGQRDEAVQLEEAQVPISHESGKSLMAKGSDALHDYVSTKLERSLGNTLPQMEIRVSNLSISADVTVSKDESPASELPTVYNTAKRAVAKLNSKSHTMRKDILKNVNAVFKPGTTTLVLGQPGSGKSSLMKYLSGTFPMRKNVHIEGDIHYNGTNRQDLIERLPQFVAYVPQREVHYPMLTVKETLEFAHAVCGGGLTKHSMDMLKNASDQENLEALEAARAMFDNYPDIVIQQLGLDNCKDTIVGNEMVRGISGGEKKRVTTGEMEFGMKYATFMDEVSTGLDSAAAHDIIQTQRSIARKFRKTVVIALLQPPPEVFELFDNILILNDGETIYNGPRESVERYFEALGFKRPEDRDLADYLMDLSTKEQYRYVTDRSAFKSQPRLPSEYAAEYKSSQIYQEVLQALESPYDPDIVHNTAAHMDPMPTFRLPFLRQLGVLMKRQTKVTVRNTAFLKGRGFMAIIIALLYGSVFYNVDPTNAQVTMGILFQAVLFLGLGQAAQLPMYMDARATFYKQRSSNFFSSLAYTFSCSVNQLPLALGESIIFGSIVYWMCGLVSDAGAFIIYLLTLILTNLSFAAYFFFISAITPDLSVAKPAGMVSMLFFILFAGFLLPKGEMPDYVVWIYWIDPIAWCLRSLAVNQYQSDKFNVCVYDDTPGAVNYCKQFGQKMGKYYLSSFGVPTGRNWIVYSFIFMIAVYCIFMLLGAYVLEHKRYDGPEHISLNSAEEVEEDTYKEVTTPKADTQDEDVAVVRVQTGHYERQFIPVTVAFRDLVYTVPVPDKPKESIDLLKGITGYAFPGKITALMGSSGAGKTTLMDVIAGRKTGGKIQGEILLNGHPATDLAIRRCTGYCEQMDIHSSASTFREALTFSAFLRQGSDVPDSKKYDSVNECLDLLDMNAIADQIIRGSSVEQMKRLTIGVELAAQPSVLFLDEPTSGLDARSAKLIMDGVRNVADSGRTIICTIHQPSYKVFSVFDSLLLLKRGGETVYFGEIGENCRTLIDYFEELPGVEPVRKGYNPATWMLEVIGAGVGRSDNNNTDFVEIFQKSEKKRQLDQVMQQDGVGVPSTTVGALSFGKKRAASSIVQCKFVVGRFLDLYWRSPSYNLTRIAVMVVMALIYGIIYVSVDYDTYQGINGGIGIVFVSTLFSGIISFNSVLPITGQERAAFYRERASQTYNALWYFVGATVAEIPYVFGTNLIFTAIFYPMLGFQGFRNGVLYWLASTLNVLFMAYFGQLFVYALPSVEVAAIMGVLINTIMLAMMGFNPPADLIPQGYVWLYKITPYRFPLAIVEALAFARCENDGDLGCETIKELPNTVPYKTVKEYTEGQFKMKYDDIGLNFGIIIAWIVGSRLLALLALRFINHQKR